MSVNDRKSGSVKFFNQVKGWGVIIVDGPEVQEIFFHVHDYRAPTNSDEVTDRIPCKGDQIVFRQVQGGKGPKASPWAFDVEFPPTVPLAAKEVSVSQILVINRHQIMNGDIVVGTGNSTNHGDPIYWDDVIYRPATGEIFLIHCWDGSSTSYQTELPNGKLPNGVTIKWER